MVTDKKLKKKSPNIYKQSWQQVSMHLKLTETSNRLKKCIQINGNDFKKFLFKLFIHPCKYFLNKAFLDFYNYEDLNFGTCLVNITNEWFQKLMKMQDLMIYLLVWRPEALCNKNLVGMSKFYFQSLI